MLYLNDMSSLNQSDNLDDLNDVVIKDSPLFIQSYPLARCLAELIEPHHGFFCSGS